MSTTAVLSAPTFTVDGPLPSGTVVLEASAGTGKTYTIAALATRYVAEGVAGLDRLMLVTFGRDATQELRERVRERLVGTERALAAVLAGGPAPSPGSDPVVALLADGDPAEIEQRRARLADAAASFDAATIATTHQFCSQMLAGLGVAGDNDPDAEFVEHVDDVVTEVVDDFYVRKYASPKAGRPAFTRTEALALARRAVGDPQAELEPRDADPDSVAATRYGFATAVRREVDARKRRLRIYSYDDMLSRLAAALRDPVRGPAARERLRSRYSVVLVDEFQDTDPLQWEILSHAFHEAPRTTLVLIGDPKQAIYAFRGADVHSYLRAAEAATQRRTLDTNRRSDAALLESLDAVFGEAALGDDGIVVHRVAAAHHGRRLVAAQDAPLRLRTVDRDRLDLTGRGLGRAPGARQVVARDVALDLSRLLDGSARYAGRELRPGQVAVLVRTNAQGQLVRDACADAGVPAVLTGSTSVFTTPVAQDWLTLLEAVEQPQRSLRLRTAALTRFVGYTVADLCGPDADRLVDQLGADLRAWHQVLADRGVAALQEAVFARYSPAQRLLGRPDGERDLTDLRHIGQVLHSAALERHLGPTALTEWLRHRIGEAARDTSAERSRRLESDADAVQIVTVHRSKGLEFPVVYLPFAWDRWVNDTPDPLLYHDAADGRPRRLLDVGGPSGPDRARRTALHQAEEAGEDLRLLYVALTRACSQVVAWWVPATTTASSSLHRMLFGHHRGGCEPEAAAKVPGDADAVRHLRERLSGSGVVVETLHDRDPVFREVEPDGGQPAVAEFRRTLDTAWRRTSYTALTAAAHAAHRSHTDADDGSDGEPAAPPGVLTEPEVEGVRDEPQAAAPGGAGPPSGPVSPGSVPSGSAPPEAAPSGAGSSEAGPYGTAASEAGSSGAAPSGAAPSGSAGAVHPGVSAVDPATVASPMADLPMGAGFGTLVHAVLEHLDTTVAAQGDAALRAELVRHVGDELRRQPADVDPEQLADALVPVLRTPLGPLAGGRALADVAPADRLSELDFELPLCGGDSPSGRLTLAGLAAAVRRHLGPGDVLHGYADRLDSPDLAGQPLRGYLTGSIDSVLRVDDRFLVVDYKTNWLGPAGAAGREPLTAAHYTAPRLAEAMADAHYPLQALLYAVALHRYLRWRLPGYDPAVHLGGVGYLFLRGMCGPDTPVTGDGPIAAPCGVFAWQPPAALVEDLSDLLDGGSA
ncbi:exodeoxyribonuclease V beta subunit [Pseudonocardia ammonioxydans]|uniref:RecBCD enzyme subunit RecB n=1 Tax=Pseudonocardia ammonioxydans TaxID=260086 RepID=A0A1I5E0Q1_PSUAM|nr:UvrD-helicase domain-containing protein [Pseudonocardia ammonioxydans]SFO05036.1 exodeoxyribonuclease V beta subunit [Pseudonocardia ammonioxydans]